MGVRFRLQDLHQSHSTSLFDQNSSLKKKLDLPLRMCGQVYPSAMSKQKNKS